jgi:hypothetical protein
LGEEYFSKTKRTADGRTDKMKSDNRIERRPENDDKKPRQEEKQKMKRKRT